MQQMELPWGQVPWLQPGQRQPQGSGRRCRIHLVCPPEWQTELSGHVFQGKAKLGLFWRVQKTDRGGQAALRVKIAEQDQDIDRQTCQAENYGLAIVYMKLISPAPHWCWRHWQAGELRSGSHGSSSCCSPGCRPETGSGRTLAAMRPGCRR